MAGTNEVVEHRMITLGASDIDLGRVGHDAYVWCSCGRRFDCANLSIPDALENLSAQFIKHTKP